MNFITGRHLSRRTFLRGGGASVALPFIDAMVPAGRPWSDPAQSRFTRLVCIEESMGCAGGNDWGDAQNLFAPARAGRDFELKAESQLKPLERFREYLTIVSNTDVRMAEPYRAEEIGGDHDRSTAVFLTQAHPLQTQADVFLGKSLDQVHADRFGQGHRPAVARDHDRADGPRGRVRLQLPLRVHDDAGLGVAQPAATRDP